MFSVVIPLYNQGAWIERALASVGKQTQPAAEVIVVDDGSTDDGPARVARLTVPGLRLLRQANGGVGSARNRGCAAAGQEFVALLDADDEWLPQHLETLAGLCRDFPEAGVIGAGYVLLEPGGPPVAIRLAGIPAAPWRGVLPDYFAIAARSDPPLWTSALAVRRELLRQVGGVPTGLRTGEDLLTWARLAAAGPVALDTTVSAIYHRPPASAEAAPKVPDAGDPVGQGLRALLPQVAAAARPGLRRYLGQWHRMRGATFLMLGQRQAGARELLAAWRWTPWDCHLPLYLGALLLPTRGRGSATSLMRWFRGRRRPTRLPVAGPPAGAGSSP